jgi:hypothetical protein
VTAETPEEAPRPRCIWWSDPSDDFYGRCIHDAPHGGPHLNEHGVGWYGERWDHNTAQEPKPAPGPAELQFLLDNERTERLHRAGERDEARSDLRRMHRLALDVLATLPDGSARERRWRDKADAIIGRHSQPRSAPELAKLRADVEATWDADLMAERDELRNLLDEIGVMAANAPEDGDSFGVLEQIAMRIAAAGVPDSSPNGVTGTSSFPSPEDDLSGSYE